MIDVTATMAAALDGIPYPCCEAPMREKVQGIYVTWEIAGERTLHASGKPVLMMTDVAVGIWLPPGTRWSDPVRAARSRLRLAGIRSRIDGEEFYPEVGRNAIVLLCTLTEDVRHLTD